MLQNMRDNAQGVIAKIIIGLIIVIFAAAGIESLLGGSGSTPAAEVNGVELSAAELDQAIRSQKRRILESMGENADPALLDDALIQNSALQQLIQQKLLLQAAEQAGVVASPQAIDQLILGMSQFQDNGQFSPQLYENVLRNNGYSMAYFKQLLADDVVIRQLSSGMAGSDFVTEAELEFAASIIGQKRSYHYAVLPIQSELAKAEVSNDEQEAYYQANIAQYQREPKLQLAYIEIKQSDFVKNIDEALVKEAYDLEMSDFTADEERKVSHILLEISEQRDERAARALAADLKAKLTAGESFSDLAKAHSDDMGTAVVGGNLEYTRGGDFPEAFDKALFALKLNEVSDLVLTDAGIHLIQVTDIKGLDKPLYDDRRFAIKQRLELEQAESTFVSQLEQLRDMVFNSADLKGPGAELGLTVQQSGWIGRSDQTGVLSSARVLNAAFADDVLKEGNNSDVIELASDHYIVVRALDHKAAEPQPLGEVRAQITAQLKKAKAEDVLAEKAKGLDAQLADSGIDFVQLAEKNSLQLKAEEGVTRVTAKAGRELSAAIFAMVKPQGEKLSVEVIALSNGDRALVQLEKVVDGSRGDLSEPELQAVRAQLLRAISTQSLGAYEQSVRTDADIVIM